MLNEWKIINNQGWITVNHFHNEYQFTCCNLKDGVRCGLCGKFVPDYIKIQMDLLGRNFYKAYYYAPNYPYVVYCYKDNKRIDLQITRDGYRFRFRSTVNNHDQVILQNIVNSYKHIWQDIL